MHTLFFRFFYLVFVGMFAQLLVGGVIVTAMAAYYGNTISTMTAACLSGMCALLIQRAVRFMRD